MGLPFTPEQFFDVFAAYNRQFRVVVAFWWLATVGVLVLVWRQPGQRSAFLSSFLGALWLWNAAAYHAYLFTRINPAAWLFSALFAIQGVLFVWAGARRSVSYLSDSGASPVIGLVLTAYSLAYPFLTMVVGHRYPATPTFGLPCPTVILTVGLLLTVSGGIPARLALIPIMWGFIGGSAAVLLAVLTDCVLFAAALLLLVTLVSPRLSLRRGRGPVGRSFCTSSEWRSRGSSARWTRRDGPAITTGSSAGHRVSVPGTDRTSTPAQPGDDHGSVVRVSGFAILGCAR